MKYKKKKNEAIYLLFSSQLKNIKTIQDVYL